jgi:hypothetical protein
MKVIQALLAAAFVTLSLACTVDGSGTDELGSGGAGGASLEETSEVSQAVAVACNVAYDCGSNTPPAPGFVAYTSKPCVAADGKEYIQCRWIKFGSSFPITTSYVVPNACRVCRNHLGNIGSCTSTWQIDTWTCTATLGG